MPAPRTMSRSRFTEHVNRYYDSFFDGSCAFVYLHVYRLKYYYRIRGIDAGDKVMDDVIELISTKAKDQIIARYAGDGLVFMVAQDDVQELAAAINDMLPTFNAVDRLQAKMGSMVCRRPLYVEDCLRRIVFASNSILDDASRYLCEFEGAPEREFNKRLYVLDHLDEAIANGEIQAWAQPIVRVLTGNICEVEILARWQSEKYGLLMPNEFIPILEQYQLIHKLDLEVIRLACSQWAEARALGTQVPFGINLSRLDFELCDIYSEIRAIMKTFDVPVSQMHIEITESTFILDNDVLDEGIRRFSNAGFEIYMDDFGSGYSSLGQMSKLRFNVIKIDKGLIDHIEEDERARAVLADTVALVKRLGMQTLCEGVETEDQFAFLKAVGCEKAQGFFFGKATRHEDTMQRLEERARTYEGASESAFLDAVGQVNLTDCTSAAIHGVEAAAFFDRSPAVIVEYRDDGLHQLTCNFSFQHLVERMGFPSFDAMLSTGSSTAQRILKRATKTGREARDAGTSKSFDFIADGVFCQATVLFVASTDNREAYLVTIASVENAPQVTEHTLLTGVLRTSKLCFFWKDTNRRFLGANDCFLDYYGFESLDDIVGKTDEDMGWHIDNEPFQSDEYRVLEGASISAVPGVCMRKGEYRDIVATKQPLYFHGNIVGLVGFFEDVGPHQG